MIDQNRPRNRHNETLGVKNALKCFTRTITQGYLRKLHKIMITYDLIKISLATSSVMGLNWALTDFQSVRIVQNLRILEEILDNYTHFSKGSQCLYIFQKLK